MSLSNTGYTGKVYQCEECHRLMNVDGWPITNQKTTILISEVEDDMNKMCIHCHFHMSDVW